MRRRKLKRGAEKDLNGGGKEGKYDLTDEENIRIKGEGLSSEGWR